MMKLSIVRTDKKHIPHLTVKSYEWFLERIKTDTKAEDVGKFRQYIARFGDTGLYEFIVIKLTYYLLLKYSIKNLDFFFFLPNFASLKALL